MTSSQASSIVSFLNELQQKDIKIGIDGKDLVVRAPKGAITKAIGMEIRKRKEELINWLGQLNQSQDRIPVADRSQRLPLSFTQRRLWFLDQMEGTGIAYHMPICLNLKGKLDAQAMESALNGIYARHEALRTRFLSEDGEPFQVIDTVSHQDLSILQLGPLEQDARVENFARAFLEKAFDLETGPVIRFQILRLNENEHVLLVCMHHIISDGWTMNIIQGELAARYQAAVTEQSLALPKQRIQYADYAAHQHTQLEDGSYDKHLKYWVENLGDLPPLLNLPLDKPRPQLRTLVGETHTFSLEADIVQGIQALAKAGEATEFMAFQTIFATLLNRLSDQKIVAVGTPINNRNHQEVQQMVGFFANTVMVRNDFSADPNYPAMLAQVRKTSLDMQSHQEVPLENVIQALGPKRDTSYHPLFQVVFDMRDLGDNTVKLPGLQLKPLSSDTGVSHFDLVFTLVDQPDGKKGMLSFSTQLFLPWTIASICEQFKTLAQSIIANPELPLSRQPLINKAQYQQQLEVWNNTTTDFPMDQTLGDLLRMEVAKNGDALAIDDDEQDSLTYNAVYNQASKLAAQLLERGLKPSQFVGVLGSRARETVVAFVAVTLAGGAYLPLDPDFPQERLDFMIRDADVEQLLYQTEHEALMAGWKLNSIPLTPLVDGTEAAAIPKMASAHHPTYLIYTSGSTGKPKGVVVDHRAICRLVRNSNFVRLSKEDRVAHASTPTFDAATFEIWGALLNGAGMVIVPKAVQLNLPKLHAFLRDKSITTMFLTTALFNQCIDDRPDFFQSLKQVLFGGEAVDPNRVRRALQAGPPQRLLHVYGPTESTTYSAWFRVEEVPEQTFTVPIGHALSNTTQYVVSQQMGLLPPGAPGELVIGGFGLAHGYHKRPRLTAERFVPNPFGGDGERLYHTGDRVRCRPDGAVEFLGRVDHQIKLRGFRIELPEIEAALQRLPQIKHAVVILDRSLQDNHRLVAYVELESNSQQDDLLQALREGKTEALQQELGKNLPSFMLPSVYMVLDAMPLNRNLKFDRAALPKPEMIQREEADYIAPRTDQERALSQIWCDLLKLEKVGIHDNFFELGGHSLLATRVTSRIQKEFGISLPMETLFRSATIAELAPLLVESASRPALPPITPRDRQQAPPLSFAQSRLYVIDRIAPGSANYNMPFAMMLHGAIDILSLEEAANHIVRRHEALRTNFREENNHPVQIIHESAEPIIEVLDLSHLQLENEDPALMAIVETAARRPFDLGTEPLLRTSAIRLAANKHLLLVNMHHIISDGWSISIFIRELMTLYPALLQGRESPLPALEVQYADVAVWQHEQLGENLLGQQLQWWCNHLKGAPANLDLPLDFERPPIQKTEGDDIPILIPAELTTKLRQLAMEEDTTLFMTMISAYACLLSRYSGQRDLVIGSPIANRNHSESENLIGFFVNMLALRCNLEGNPSFKELLARIRETTLSAFSNQDIPFEQVVDELKPERDMSRSPIFQTSFALHKSDMGALSLPGMQVEPVPLTSNTTKFELSILLSEDGDTIAGGLEYNTSLFREETARRMADQYVQLLSAIVDNHQTPIHALPPLSQAERYALYHASEETAQAYPNQANLNALFEVVSRQSPNAIAVTGQQGQLTYKELERQSAVLAQKLRQNGIQAEDVVALAAERHPHTVATILGIIRIGATYLALDPDMPHKRLQFMIDDAGAKRILADTDNLEKAQAFGIPLEQLGESSFEGEAYPPICQAQPNTLAYLGYTSGSTGTSKAVAIPHQAVTRLVRNTNYVQLDARERIAHQANLAFDASTFEIWGPLLNGGAIVVVPREVQLSPSSMKAYLRDHQVTTMFITTALFNQLSIAESDIFATLKYILFGGEAVDPDRVRSVLDTAPPERLLHVYGPTESTTFATWHHIGEVAPEDLTIPIGCALANTTAFVLDEGLQALPASAFGELYLGGDGLARGYFNRPSLTAQRFVPNPFAKIPGDRLYKTGDRVRTLPSDTDGYGPIEFQGRFDHQVKLRGFRIELGEIETVIQRREEVAETIVIHREDQPGHPYLAAYVRFNGDVQDQAEAVKVLNDYLRENLPGFMVPSRIVPLQTLPMGPTGKIDRKALPVPELVSQAEYVPPETQTETALVEIWKEILSQEKIGIHDNFFDLGGNSLDATRIVSKVEEVFSIKLPLVKLMESPTIQALGTMVDNLKWLATPSAPPVEDLSDDKEEFEF